MKYIITVLSSLAASGCAQNTVTASASPAPQATSASGISNALDAAFAGFGIEPSNLYSFTGGNEANRLSINLLQNLADYSGIPPHLRIGGNTGDQMLYDPNYDSYSFRLKQNPTGQGLEPTDKFIFGPSYWKALNRFPRGTPITFGLNMAYSGSDYLERIVAEARACLDGLSGVKLTSFEIGNEPDLWLQNSFRTGSWGGSTYIQEFLPRAAAIYQQVLRPAGLPANFFEPACTASTIGTSFQVRDLTQLGILNTYNGSGPFVAGWNQHDYYYFVGVSTYQLTLNTLTQLSTTEGQFRAWVTQVEQAVDSKLPYYLREMANAGPIGLEGISDTFAAALWTLNFLCYTASLGIASVQFHMTDNSFASPWQPIEMYGRPAHVRPSYYAFAAMAQLIGSGNGTTQIAAFAPTAVSGGYAEYVRTYAAYTNGELSAIVLINSMSTSGSSQNSMTFALSLPNDKGKTLYISSLRAASASVTSGVTWNGISFERNRDGTPSTADTNVHTILIDSNGNAMVTVKDSEAVIANIGYQLGTHAVVVKSGVTDSPGSSTKTSVATLATSSPTTASVLVAAVTTAFILITSMTKSANASSTRRQSESSVVMVAASEPTTTSRSMASITTPPHTQIWKTSLFGFGALVIVLTIAQAIWLE
ncbi:hypothetical protein EJ08DRAFT_591840 [Tothia fuscella]|uniref:Beta-glucuronidase C-terminal domain-containing protein n=1 Tax=Tothia fuscella TaxID=1048955 RepID=A0A9P4TX49_9PEZI|nr:hypothetical protein EJ08DRAFT_591840 [Tothia fuscella]